MQAGDILVVWGSNSVYKATAIGHAAIASSSKYIMEMPGKKISKHATHTKKATFLRDILEALGMLKFIVKKTPQICE